MKPRCAWGTLLAAVLAHSARLAGAHPEALAARQILRDAGIESAFIAKTESAAAPGQSATTVFSTLFVFEGVAWNYSAEGGTTVLGRSPPAGEALPGALRPLLVRFAPPGAELTLYAQSIAVESTEMTQRPLPRSCVVGCIAALTRVLERDGAPAEAGLVLFLFGTAARFDPRNVCTLDHAVLVFRTAAGWACIDPRAPDATFALERVTTGTDLDPMLAALAKRVDRPLQHSVYFPIAPATLTRIAEQLAARAANRHSP